MLSVLLSIAVAGFVAYIVIVLFWGKSTDEQTDISDFIMDSPGWCINRFTLATLDQWLSLITGYCIHRL